jgi:hypothetical protein
MNTSFFRLRDESYFDSYNLTWSQQSNLSWQVQFPRNHVPQFHDHSYSSSHQYYQKEPPPPKSFALEEASAALDEAMPAYLSQVE